MGKAKSQNKKRSKMLRQKKKQRELAEQKNRVPDQTEIKERLNKLFNKPVTIRNSNSSEIKISDCILRMVQPLLDEARSFDKEKNIIGLGVIAWNLGVIKTFLGEDKMLESLKNLKIVLPFEKQGLLMEYVEIKCVQFSNYDQFIYDYKFTRVNDHQNNLSVAYQSVTDNDITETA